MRRLLVGCGVALGLFVSAAEVQADWYTAKAKWHSFWDRVHLDWRRNNAWPEPFATVDRQTVRTPLALMVDNGWQLQNTLTNDMFEPETQQLSAAGQFKVREIVTQYPLQRRTVFILRGHDEEATSARLESVQELVARSAGSTGGMPEVIVSDMAPRGASGDYYDRMMQGYQSTMPQPRLPTMTSGGGDGGQ